MTFPPDLSAEIKQRIANKVPDAQVEVFSAGNRHYSLQVISESFKDLTQVKQHQLVYSAISELMAGNDAPVHAIDRMELKTS